jgi:hypothetical protein
MFKINTCPIILQEQNNKDYSPLDNQIKHVDCINDKDHTLN